MREKLEKGGKKQLSGLGSPSCRNWISGRRKKDVDFSHTFHKLITMIKRVNSPPYTVDEKRLKRFPERQNIFGRIFFDKDASFYRKDMYENVEKILENHEEGYSRVDFARMMGSWTVYDYFHKAFSWNKVYGANNVMNKPGLDKFKSFTPDEMSREVKKTAELYGASLTGITELNRKWLYSKDMDNIPINIPEDFKYAVVMAVEMKREYIKNSPDFIASAASGLGYSKMAFLISCMAEFIRYLGYRAIPMGNDTALSIPLAIDAGLGELGRNGLLITPQYGPCIRICKVFTNIPLKTDKPIEFGVREFCRNCARCAEECEADAIQFEKEPSYEIKCPSNNRGILRWAINHDKCYEFWVENGSDCSTCISSCPFLNGEITSIR